MAISAEELQQSLDVSLDYISLYVYIHFTKTQIGFIYRLISPFLNYSSEVWGFIQANQSAVLQKKKY